MNGSRPAGLKVALIHNLKPSARDPRLPSDYYSECDSPKAIAAIALALRKGGHEVLPVEADRNLPAWLCRHRVDLAFNIAEGFEGESREARVPALLELLGIPYTGSGVAALALALDKAKSKHLFRCAGIPTPNFQLFQHPDSPLDARLKYPLIVKPNCDGSAKGICVSSVVQNPQQLRIQIRQVFERYKQGALVEEYIEGTELTVGILGEDELLPVLEIDFSECGLSGEFFYSWRMKEFQGDRSLHLVPRFWCPARLSPEVTQAVQSVAWKASRALGARDVARVDIRLSSDGIPYVLEVNPLPGMDPQESNLPIMIRAAGIRYDAFINRLVRQALERCRRGFPAESARAVSAKAGAASFVPLSQTQAPRSPDRAGAAAPGSQEKGGVAPEIPAVIVRDPSRPRARIRNQDSKEEHLGR